eukprot:6879690-Alexandrium_andersonii.AAC.1
MTDRPCAARGLQRVRDRVARKPRPPSGRGHRKRRCSPRRRMRTGDWGIPPPSAWLLAVFTHWL